MHPSSEISRLFPSLKMQQTLRPGKVRAEGFAIDIGSDTLRLDADSRIAQEFAMHQLLAALQSNRLGDLVGASSPLYEMRPLWIHGERPCTLPSGIEVNLPEFFVQSASQEIDLQVLHALVWQMYDLGFNTLVFAPLQGYSQKEERRTISSQALHKAFDFLRSLGIQIALHVSPASLSERREIGDWRLFFSQVTVLFDANDFLFWQASDLFKEGFKPTKKEATAFEKIEEEIAFLEKMNKCNLFYYLPCNNMDQAKDQTPWLLNLTTKISDKTILGFSASAGCPFYEQTILHPIFHEISRLPLQFKGRFVHFLGVREYGTGEKIIADFPFCFVEKALGSQRGGRFYGAGCQIRELTGTTSLPIGVLWAIGQRMWRPLNTYGLFETWLLRYHRDLKNCLNEEFFELFQNVVVAQGRIDYVLV